MVAILHPDLVRYVVDLGDPFREYGDAMVLPEEVTIVGEERFADVSVDPTVNPLSSRIGIEG
jgi:hypothetical protein